ncbi:hypothetical protein GDO81_016158, partial [Engystomops pustulosus]
LLKPQVERRRRERINSCLEKLRVLLSEVMKNEQKFKNPKMEKAEILEYTVDFLQSKIKSTQKFHKDLQSMDYLSGFRQCLQTTVNFITQNQELSPSSKEFFTQHLSSANLYKMSTTVSQRSEHLHRLLDPTSSETSKRHHNYSPAVNGVDIQSDWHSDQTYRSWRPWL